MALRPDVRIVVFGHGHRQAPPQVRGLLLEALQPAQLGPLLLDHLHNGIEWSSMF